MSDKTSYISHPFNAGVTFDIIAIKIRHERDYPSIANKAISEQGMIIFYNTDWFINLCNDFRLQKWSHFVFFGIRPINSDAWTVSGFVRTNVKFTRSSSAPLIGGNHAGQA